MRLTYRAQTFECEIFSSSMKLLQVSKTVREKAAACDFYSAATEPSPRASNLRKWLRLCPTGKTADAFNAVRVTSKNNSRWLCGFKKSTWPRGNHKNNTPSIHSLKFQIKKYQSRTLIRPFRPLCMVNSCINPQQERRLELNIVGELEKHPTEY